MKARFYQQSKRNKSTMIPSGNYYEVDVQLKEQTSILSPTLLLSSFAPVFYNYVYIPEWKRCYFISNTASVEGMWEVSLAEDYLATFKDYILNTVANVLYAATSTRDITDSRIPVKATVTRKASSASLGFSLNPVTGRIILGITGNGSFGCFILKNASQLNDLLDGIDDWAEFITDNWDFTKQLFFGGSASECLKSALKIPIAFKSEDHGDLEDLNLGNYPCQDSNGNHIQGYNITDPILDYVANVDIPWIYDDWRNVSNYTEVSLYIPLIGLITLPASELKNENLGLLIDYKINITSGDIACLVKGKTAPYKIYATANGNCAIPVAFGSTGIDTNKLTTAAITGVGTIAAISAATGGLGAIAEGITGGELLGNAAIGASIGATALQTMQALGGSGNGSAGMGGGAAGALDDKVYCFVTSKQITDTQSNFANIMGRPYMGVSAIEAFQGYVQTDGFQLASDFAYSSEKDMVNKLMDSGVYIE